MRKLCHTEDCVIARSVGNQQVIRLDRFAFGACPPYQAKSYQCSDSSYCVVVENSYDDLWMRRPEEVSAVIYQDQPCGDQIKANDDVEWMPTPHSPHL